MPDRMDDLLRADRHVVQGELDWLEFAIADYIAKWGEHLTGRPYDGNIAGLPCAVANMAMTVIRKNIIGSPTPAVAEAVTLLDAIHRPDPCADQCMTCGPEGGRWPCASREVADDLRGVLDTEGER